jgi:fructokinase
MKLLSFGEILWDLYPTEKYIGGAPFNFAAHVAKHGESVYLLSCLGMDDLADQALEQLEAFGIFTDYVSRSHAYPTGRCVVTLDEQGIPSYDLVSDVAYDHIPCDGIVEDFDVLYFGTLALRSEDNFRSLGRLLQEKQFREIFVDVNLRPPFYSQKTLSFALEKATILKISHEELPLVAQMLDIENHQDFPKTLQEKYPNLKILLITCGAEGAYCYNGMQEHFCPAPKVEVASTVGAGDSFLAAFLYQFTQKRELPFCLQYATQVAGFVVSQYEAVPDDIPKIMNGE